MTTTGHTRDSSGLAAGLGAYLLWGLMPLLFHALRDVAPFELVAWRVIFTVPVCIVFVAAARGWDDLRAALANRAVMGRLCASALAIAANWTIYVTAVVNGHVLATSLGYYINPLLNVLIGTVLLRERLGPRQWAAVVIAGCGVALLVAGALQMLGIAFALAGSFAFYGLIRKTTHVGAITGLTVETLLLLPLAAGWALVTLGTPHGAVITQGGARALLIAGSGIATGVPLVLFGMAARRLPLSTLGFLQFTAPTLVFLIGVFVVGEPLDRLKLACFALIWIAVALFVQDLWARTRLLNRQTAS